VYETINEQINVLVRFANGKIAPVYFTWKNRKVILQSLNFVHTSKEGTAKLIHFSASNDTNNYKLTYNTQDQSWVLNEIYA